MSDLQSLLQLEIKKCDFKVSVYTRVAEKFVPCTTSYKMACYHRCREHLVFWSGRRRYWLRKLLKTQLKEFSRE